MLIILILQVRFLTVTEDHPVQPSLAVDGSASLLLTAKTSHRAQWHAKQVITLAHNTLCHTSPPLASGDAKWGILSIPLDKFRVCYSPSHVWNFILNPISTVELQHSEAQAQDDEQKAKFSLSHKYVSGPMPQPRKKVIICQVLPQGAFSFFCSVLKTSTRYISAFLQG